MRCLLNIYLFTTIPISLPPKCCLFPNHTITGLYRVECERFAVTGRSNHANHGDEAFHPYVAALSGRPNTHFFPFSSTAPPIVCSKVGLSVTKKLEKS